MSQLITETLEAPDGSVVTIEIDYEMVINFICHAMPQRVMVTDITFVPEFIDGAYWKSHRYQPPDASPVPAFKGRAFTGSLKSISDDFQYRVCVGCKHRLTNGGIQLSEEDMGNIYDSLSHVSWLRFKVELIPPSDNPIPPFPLFGGLRERKPSPKKKTATPKKVDWNGFQISTRAQNTLRNAGCQTISDILAMTEDYWLSYPNCGAHTAREIMSIVGKDTSKMRQINLWNKLRTAIWFGARPDTLTDDDLLMILAKIKGTEEKVP